MKLKNLESERWPAKIAVSQMALCVKAGDYFGMITPFGRELKVLLFTFLIKEKSKSLSGLRT